MQSNAIIETDPRFPFATMCGHWISAEVSCYPLIVYCDIVFLNGCACEGGIDGGKKNPSWSGRVPHVHGVWPPLLRDQKPESVICFVLTERVGHGYGVRPSLIPLHAGRGEFDRFLTAANLMLLRPDVDFGWHFLWLPPVFARSRSCMAHAR